MTSTKAVLISDIHYNINTLELADKSLRQAIELANELEVPVIVAGDLHDTKANLRGECITAMIETMKTAHIKPYVLVGNHDKIHEKSQAHSLDFLKSYVNLIEKPGFTNEIACNRNSLEFIPYQHSIEDFKHALNRIDSKSVIIAHQGITGSDSGEYIQDKSAVTQELVKDHRIISGHYHKRQTIGSWDYIGNPYSLGYGEANDPEKGFQVLHDDGTLTFVPTNLRKHIVVDITMHSEALVARPISSDDLVWVKVRGTKEELLPVNKDSTRREVFLRTGLELPKEFKLDLIPLGTTTVLEEETKVRSHQELLDKLIESLSNVGDLAKDDLKQLWRDL